MKRAKLTALLGTLLFLQPLAAHAVLVKGPDAAFLAASGPIATPGPENLSSPGEESLPGRIFTSRAYRQAAESLMADEAATDKPLTNFGTSTFTVATEFTTYSTAAQAASSISLVGNDASTLAGLFEPVDLTGYTTLVLQGSVSVNPQKVMAIELFDADFHIASFTGGSWVELGGQGRTTFSLHDAEAGFDFSNVVAVNVNSVGVGADAVEAVFTGLSAVAVPEPGVSQLLAAGLATALYLRRRRS